MTFEEKIRILLISNEKEITSASALEKFLDVAQGGITKYLNDEKEPPPSLERVICRGLGVNPAWWVVQKEPIYIEKGTSVKNISMPAPDVP